MTTNTSNNYRTNNLGIGQTHHYRTGISGQPTRPEKPVFLYFNSWGASKDQSLYLSNPLTVISPDFYVFTVQMSNYGGFDANIIPMPNTYASSEFRTAMVGLTEQLLTQVVNQVDYIISQHPNQPVVLLSHSFGYTMLFAVLHTSIISKRPNLVPHIILLDPAGKGSSGIEMFQNVEVYRFFTEQFNQFRQAPASDTSAVSVFATWKQFIKNSTQSLFTTPERHTGMYQYILDCANNSQLDLSIYAYGAEFWPIYRIIKEYTSKYPNKIVILTSTNGIAYQNQSYWNELGINQIKTISQAGHFLQIFSQVATINAICEIIKRPMITFVPYTTTYNAPLTELPITELSDTHSKSSNKNDYGLAWKI
jgi:pimeloyl-ACP methyl ester carboxylesterase